MIPKFFTALISAAILSAVLGALPCEATGAKKLGGKKPAMPAPYSASASSDLNRPATDFSGVKPVTDNPHPDLIAPKKNRNEFFDQTIR